VSKRQRTTTAHQNTSIGGTERSRRRADLVDKQLMAQEESFFVAQG